MSNYVSVGEHRLIVTLLSHQFGTETIHPSVTITIHTWFTQAKSVVGNQLICCKAVVKFHDIDVTCSVATLTVDSVSGFLGHVKPDLEQSGGGTGEGGVLLIKVMQS